MAEFILEDFRSWPPSLLEVLSDYQDTFVSWNESHEDTEGRYTQADYEDARFRARRYDRAIEGVSSELGTHSAVGMHCTRLTQNEASHISNNGMFLPNLEALRARIDALQSAQAVSPDIAERLRRENLADHQYRKNCIWFCFFEPKLAGQGGIECFFKSWGGEALYNLHERDDVTGTALQQVGSPYLIEALVPLGSLSNLTSLADKVARRYLVESGLPLREPTKHEGATLDPLPKDAILSVIPHSSERFVELTGCNLWSPPLLP